MNPSLRFAWRGTIWLLGLIALVSQVAYPQAAVSKSNESESGVFRWITPDSNPQLWKQIQESFGDEIKPDKPSAGMDDVDIFAQKRIEKVGALNHSAFVIVSHRPRNDVFTKNPWDEYSDAYNYNFISKQKSTIPNAESMWQWKFLKLARFGPSQIPDAVFTYLDCTECEPSQLLTSLRYDTATEKWEIRPWGDGKDVWWASKIGLATYVDVNDGGDTISFDCAYGIQDLIGNGFDAVAVRCKQVEYGDAERLKIDDTTLLYSLSGGRFVRRRVTDVNEVVGLTAKICQGDSTGLLCKLPAYITPLSRKANLPTRCFQPPRRLCAT